MLQVGVGLYVAAAVQLEQQDLPYQATVAQAIFTLVVWVLAEQVYLLAVAVVAQDYLAQVQTHQLTMAAKAV
jgi:hypothetical protein